MITEFNSYIKYQKLFTASDRLLVAVSGGADSIALCHLLMAAHYNFSVAHCNFGLRGKESEGDEEFIIDFCKKYKIPVFIKKFSTTNYAEEKRLSIQMAAREMRYNWFKELVSENKFDSLLTAHHKNDAIETFFINLLRGSGVNGLKSILPKAEKIVRPLLFATRLEIENYINENNIPYREDSSNREDKYLRNQLRLQVIPLLKKLNPSFEKTISSEIEILQQTNLILKKEVANQRKNLLIDDNESFKIRIEELKKATASKLILFELIKEFNFNSSQAADIYDALDAQSGKVFESHTHTILKDREFLLIRKRNEKSRNEFLIQVSDAEISEPVKLKISYLDGNIESVSESDFLHTKAFIDFDKLTFPLTITTWQPGDKFKPLGMKGFKKVSDFFIAEKASLFDKQNQWILRNGPDIVWIIGKRLDDRYKVTSLTKKICVITLT